MRAAVRLVLLIWATVSALSLVALLYVLPGYSLDSAFSAALGKHPSPQASFWFHWSMIFLFVGICMTACLYLTHRKYYGKVWKSD
jgi:hypothetical protein